MCPIAERARPLHRSLLAVLFAAAAVPGIAAEGDMVVVDQKELSAYWRADQGQTQTLEVKVEGTEYYGCMAVPFVIDPQGRVSPGREPLLARIGTSSTSVPPDIGALYMFAMGALPGYTPTWDKPLSDTIYSSHAIVLGDARIRARIGDEKWAALRTTLEAQCRIDNLAGWVAKNLEPVVQTLPARPEQLLAASR